MCPECRDWLLAKLGKIPPDMFAAVEPAEAAAR